MAEQPGDRRSAVEVGEELISLMVPDVDPELVQLMLSRRAAGGRADSGGRRSGGDTPQAELGQEYAELLALIRDAGIDRVRLRTILGLKPETLPVGDGNPHPDDIPPTP